MSVELKKGHCVRLTGIFYKWNNISFQKQPARAYFTHIFGNHSQQVSKISPGWMLS